MNFEKLGKRIGMGIVVLYFTGFIVLWGFVVWAIVKLFQYWSVI